MRCDIGKGSLEIFDYIKPIETFVKNEKEELVSLKLKLQKMTQHRKQKRLYSRLSILAALYYSSSI